MYKVQKQVLLNNGLLEIITKLSLLSLLSQKQDEGYLTLDGGARGICTWEKANNGLLRYWQYSITDQGNCYLSIYYTMISLTVSTKFIYFLIFMINSYSKYKVINYLEIRNYKKDSYLFYMHYKRHKEHRHGVRSNRFQVIFLLLSRLRPWED